MAKTIFNTSEKSNFILNLTEEKYSGMASISLILPFILISLSVIPCEFNIDNISYPIISGALSVCGVICMIMSIIAFIKGYVKKEKLIPVLSFGAMILWGIVSLADSYDRNVSFYGFNGRGEGLLAIVFYFCFLVTASAISADRFRMRIFDALIVCGIINSLWALPQIFIDSMPSKYDYISSSGDIHACSGLSQSPLFLAMVLSYALIASVAGGMLFEGKKRKIIYTVSSLLFGFVMMFTYSLISIAGISLSVIIAVITVFIKKSSKINLLRPVGVILSALCAVLLVSSGAVCENSDYSLHDGSLMWFDSFNRLGASGNYSHETIDIEDTFDVYSYMNSRTLDIIKKYPLTGTGEENLVYPQIYSSYNIIENTGTFDKNYNEYLYVTATRGIPSLVFFLGVLISILYIGFRRLKSDKNNIYFYLSMCITLCGTVIFFIGAGNINFSPLFWIFAGLLISGKSDGIPEKS